MKTFLAKLLFDGDLWHENYYFSVDNQGLIQKAEDTKDFEELAIVIPGFINGHSHSFQRAMAGFTEYNKGGSDSFWSWRERMYLLANSLSFTEFQKIANFLMLENLKSGYTTLVEFHYLHHQKAGQFYRPKELLSQVLINSAKKFKLRLRLLPVFYQEGGFNKEASFEQKPFLLKSVNEYLDFFNNLKIFETDNIGLGLALHSIRALKKEAISDILAEFNYNLPIHIHIAEQELEVNDCLNYYQKRPVAWFLDNFNCQENFSFIHATHINLEEIKAMTEAKVTALLCPITEANLGDGIFPLSEFLSHSGNFAIGSDSNLILDPFEELRLLEFSQRLLFKKRCVATLEKEASTAEVLFKNIANSAKNISGFLVGKLKPGYFADFLVLKEDHHATVLAKPKNLLDRLVFSGSKDCIAKTYVAGNLIDIDSHYQKALNDFASVLNNYV